MTKKAIKYSEAVAKLNAILSGLESERVDVDDVAVKVKEAIELIKLCRERIGSGKRYFLTCILESSLLITPKCIMEQAIWQMPQPTHFISSHSINAGPRG